MRRGEFQNLVDTCIHGSSEAADRFRKKMREEVESNLTGVEEEQKDWEEDEDEGNL